MTKSSDARKDFIGRFGPDERPRALIRDVDVAGDRGFQLPRAAVNPTPDLLIGEHCEPALDEVDPGGARRGEMEVVARMAHEPPMDEGRLVRAIVVEDHVHVERGRDGGLDSVEELAELRG